MYQKCQEACGNVPIVACGGGAVTQSEMVVGSGNATFAKRQNMDHTCIRGPIGGNYVNGERPFLQVARLLTRREDLIFVNDEQENASSDG